MTQQHTVGTLTYDPRMGRLINQNGDYICMLYSINEEVNASFIVQACNAHDDLLAALEHTLPHLEELADAWRRGALSEHDGKGGTRSNRNMDCLQEARAAVAKATSPEATP